MNNDAASDKLFYDFIGRPAVRNISCQRCRQSRCICFTAGRPEPPGAKRERSSSSSSPQVAKKQKLDVAAQNNAATGLASANPAATVASLPRPPSAPILTPGAASASTFTLPPAPNPSASSAKAPCGRCKLRGNRPPCVFVPGAPCAVCIQAKKSCSFPRPVCAQCAAANQPDTLPRAARLRCQAARWGIACKACQKDGLRCSLDASAPSARVSLAQNAHGAAATRAGPGTGNPTTSFNAGSAVLPAQTAGSKYSFVVSEQRADPEVPLGLDGDGAGAVEAGEDKSGAQTPYEDVPTMPVEEIGPPPPSPPPPPGTAPRVRARTPPPW